MVQEQLTISRGQNLQKKKPNKQTKTKQKKTICSLNSYNDAAYDLT